MGLRSPDPLEHVEGLTRSVYAYVAYRIGPGPDAEDATHQRALFTRLVAEHRVHDGHKHLH